MFKRNKSFLVVLELENNQLQRINSNFSSCWAAIDYFPLTSRSIYFIFLLPLVRCFSFFLKY